MASAARLEIGRERPDASELVRQFEQLKSARGVWDSHWQEVKDRIWPHSEDFTRRRTQGDKRTERMLDATAALALEKFAAVMESLLTPRQQQWHRLKPSDEDLADDSEVKAWLELATKRLFAARAAPRSGYYSQKAEGYKSLGAYGNECLFSEPHPLGGIRYRHCSISRVYVALDPFGQVDTVFYSYEQTAKQSVQTWKEKAPEKAKQALLTNPWQTHEYLHVVRPYKWRDTNVLGSRGMPWESIYLCVDDKTILDVGGYREMPYMYSRYTVNPAETYGRSPAMLVLGNVKILQEQKRTFLAAGHKAVDPPLLLHNDGVLGTGGKAFNLRPGSMNYGGLDAQGRELVKPLITGARLDLTHEMMMAERDVIHDAFLVRLFQILVEDPHVKTATEVLVRAQEKGELTAPAVGRQQSEMLGPQIARDLSILLEAGELPPPPPQLESYEIEYESPATQYQKASKVVGVMRTIEAAAPFVNADPGLMLKFRGDKIIDAAADANGVPVDLIRTAEEYAEARAEYDQAQQMARMVEMGQGVAAGAKDMAAAGAAGGAGGPA